VQGTGIPVQMNLENLPDFTFKLFCRPSQISHREKEANQFVWPAGTSQVFSEGSYLTAGLISEDSLEEAEKIPNEARSSFTTIRMLTE